MVFLLGKEHNLRNLHSKSLSLLASPMFHVVAISCSNPQAGQANIWPALVSQVPSNRSEAGDTDQRKTGCQGVCLPGSGRVPKV